MLKSRQIDKSYVIFSIKIIPYEIVFVTDNYCYAVP